MKAYTLGAAAWSLKNATDIHQFWLSIHKKMCVITDEKYKLCYNTKCDLRLEIFRNIAII